MFIAALLLANPAYPVDINLCSLVAEGRSEVIDFPARMAGGAEVTLSGIVTTPHGAGPFSAIVMLPGGGGLVTPYCYRAVVESFTQSGFVTLVVASTTARDRGGNAISRYSFVDQASHAYAAASAAEKLSNVDRGRIGLWGHSLGGLGVIQSVSGDRERARRQFRAAVAAAPVCPAKAASPAVPTLLIIGDSDTEVSVSACKDLAASLKDAEGFEFFLIPDAGHSYWAQGMPGYNESSAKLSQRRLEAFLAKHLRAAH